MAAIKFKSALGVERGYEYGFGGIDRTAKGRRDNTLFLAKNLDLNTDGSLSSRGGYRQIRNLDGEFRGHFSKGSKLYTVIGNQFELTDTDSGSVTCLGALETDHGHAEIFCFGGDIYVHDSIKLYRLQGEELSPVEGCAPYYGQGWSPLYGGMVHDDINYLSDRIMISYTISGTASSFYLGLGIASIDRVETSGLERDISNFSLTKNSDGAPIIKASEAVSGIEITFWLTLSPEESQKHRLAAPIRAFVFGNNGGERLCFYLPDCSGHIYCSKPIGPSVHISSKRTAPNEIPLYISKKTTVCIGSGADSVMGMADHYGRALLFTDLNTWCVDFEDKESNTDYHIPKVFMLNSAIGSEIQSGSAYCENDPVTYSHGSLWRWHSRSAVLDECSASLMSEVITDIFPENSDALAMLSIPQKGLIYILDPDSDEGGLLIYNTRLNAWTLYKSIFAEKLLRYGNSAAFVRGDALFVLSRSLECDKEDDESFAINSSFSSHFFDFDTPERTKRTLNLILSCELGEDGGKISFENERGEISTIKLSGGKQTVSESLHLPRFKRIRIKAESNSRAVWRSLILSAK